MAAVPCEKDGCARQYGADGNDVTGRRGLCDPSRFAVKEQTAAEPRDQNLWRRRRGQSAQPPCHRKANG
jgi:hypothetical protein